MTFPRRKWENYQLKFYEIRKWFLLIYEGTSQIFSRLPDNMNKIKEISCRLNVIWESFKNGKWRNFYQTTHLISFFLPSWLKKLFHFFLRLSHTEVWKLIAKGCFMARSTESTEDTSSKGIAFHWRMWKTRKREKNW